MSRRTRKCAWPKCERRIAPSHHMCREHFLRLSPGTRDRLGRIKPWFAEAQAIRAEAMKEAREIAKREDAPTTCGTPGCSNPAAKCLPFSECVQCHRARILNQTNRLLGEHDDD